MNENWLEKTRIEIQLLTIGKLKIICHLHINDLNIYKYLFWMPYLNTEKTKSVNFGIISSSDNRALNKDTEIYNFCRVH